MRKTKEHIQVQVGAFMAIGILLFMTAIFMLGSKTSIFQTHYKLICYFDDISGLRVGAPVQLAGITVGFIDSIDFENVTVESFEFPTEDQETTETDRTKPRTIVKVKVTMKVDSRYQNRIRSDSVASVVTQGLLGDRMIYITVGSVESKKLKNNDEIKEVRQPTGFTQLVQKGDDLMNVAKGFVIDTNELVLKLNSVMDEVIKGDGLVHEVIYDPDSKKTLRSINDTLYNFNVASRNLASITGKINNGKGTLGALVNDDSLYQSIKTLFGKANRNRLIRSVIRYTLKTRDKDQLK